MRLEGELSTCMRCKSLFSAENGVAFFVESAEAFLGVLAEKELLLKLALQSQRFAEWELGSGLYGALDKPHGQGRFLRLRRGRGSRRRRRGLGGLFPRHAVLREQRVLLRRGPRFRRGGRRREERGRRGWHGRRPAARSWRGGRRHRHIRNVSVRPSLLHGFGQCSILPRARLTRSRQPVLGVTAATTSPPRPRQCPRIANHWAPVSSDLSVMT